MTTATIAVTAEPSSAYHVHATAPVHHTTASTTTPAIIPLSIERSTLPLPPTVSREASHDRRRHMGPAPGVVGAVAMSAHLRDIAYRCDQAGCVLRARVEAVNTFNAPVGRYCSRHGERKLADLLSVEKASQRR